MSNIAEGFERINTQEKLHFYNIARAFAVTSMLSRWKTQLPGFFAVGTNSVRTGNNWNVDFRFMSSLRSPLPNLHDLTLISELQFPIFHIRSSISEMSDTVISVENLGKKYRIHHQQRERYTALRDVIANKFAAPFHWLAAGRSKNGAGSLLPNSQLHLRSPISHLLRSKTFGPSKTFPSR